MDTRSTVRQAKFDAHHAAHPELYREFCTLAYELWNSDVRQFSANGILAVMRYNMAVSRRAQVKIDIAFGSLYAKTLRDEDSRFSEFFR